MTPQQNEFIKDRNLRNHLNSVNDKKIAVSKMRLTDNAHNFQAVGGGRGSSHFHGINQIKNLRAVIEDNNN